MKLQTDSEVTSWGAPTTANRGWPRSCHPRC